MIKTLPVKSNFWNCFEVDCISRAFYYKDYVSLHKETKQIHALLLEESYNFIREAFNHQMRNDLQFKEYD